MFILSDTSTISFSIIIPNSYCNYSVILVKNIIEAVFNASSFVPGEEEQFIYFDKTKNILGYFNLSFLFISYQFLITYQFCMITKINSIKSKKFKFDIISKCLLAIAFIVSLTMVSINMITNLTSNEYQYNCSNTSYLIFTSVLLICTFVNLLMTRSIYTLILENFDKNMKNEINEKEYEQYKETKQNKSSINNSLRKKKKSKCLSINNIKSNNSFQNNELNFHSTPFLNISDNKERFILPSDFQKNKVLFEDPIESDIIQNEKNIFYFENKFDDQILDLEETKHPNYNYCAGKFSIFLIC